MGEREQQGRTGHKRLSSTLQSENIIKLLCGEKPQLVSNVFKQFGQRKQINELFIENAENVAYCEWHIWSL